MWRDLLSSVTSLARLSLAGAELLVFAELVLQLCAELGAARGLLTSALVDVVLRWTRPRTNKRTEQLHARAALGLVRKVAVIICGDSRQSFQFLYHQLRARFPPCPSRGMNAQKNTLLIVNFCGPFCT